MDLSPPSAHLHLGALHRGLQASSGVSLATGVICGLSKLLFLHQVSLAARITLRKEKKKGQNRPIPIHEWISAVCLCSTGYKKQCFESWNKIFSKHLYGPEFFSAKTDREGTGMSVCAWPRRVSHCHSCLCTTPRSQEICIGANTASSSACPVDTMALGKQLAQVVYCQEAQEEFSNLWRVVLKSVRFLWGAEVDLHYQHHKPFSHKTTCAHHCL